MKKKVLIPILALIGILIIEIGTSFYSYALVEPIKQVQFSSKALSYDEKEPGSINVEKSAEWISKGKARITFNIDTVAKESKQAKDVIFVLDVSGSMAGEKLNKVKQDAIELTRILLNNPDNRAALITFDTESRIISEFTDNKEEFITSLESLEPLGNTNYYQALLNVERILKNYTEDKTKDLLVLFLTDGCPNEEIPNEVGQYSLLKSEYPSITIQGIQYEIGEEVLDPIKKISDNQFIAHMDSLHNVMLDCSVATVPYENFVLTDFIDDEYFSIGTVSDIKATVGDVKLEYEGNTPKVIWSISHLKSGKGATLTIDITLNDKYMGSGGLYPTNKKEELSYKIDNVEEIFSSEETPILSSHYEVTYDGNAPSGCTVNGLPEAQNVMTYEKVEVAGAITCEGYQFKEWDIVTDNVWRINKDYFLMPEKDVTLRAVWTKVQVEKTTEGTISEYIAPVIQEVPNNYNQKLWKYKSSITRIVFQPTIGDMPEAVESFDISSVNNSGVMAHIVQNGSASTYTAYIQGDGKIQANPNSINLFNGFSNLQTIDGLEHLSTRNVTNMEAMFDSCSSLTSLDLSTFDTSKVENFNYMFSACQNLEVLNVSNFNTSSAIHMRNMFYKCHNVLVLDVSGFDTTNVVTIKSMFNECKKITSLDLSNFRTPNLIWMEGAFSNCHSLTALDLSTLDTSHVQNMQWLFSECHELTNLDLSTFDTTNVTDMQYMFSGCDKLQTLIVGNWNTGKVTTMDKMFNGCESLLALDLSTFTAPETTKLTAMFFNCNNIQSIDLSGLKVSKVTDLSYMFYNCQALTDLKIMYLSTPNATNMEAMFYNCSSLPKLICYSLNTANVTNFSLMFRECSSLTGLQLYNFDTSKAKNMQGMFYGCSNILELDLAGWNTSNVTNMSEMFSSCGALKELDLSDWNTSNVTTMKSMFAYCGSIHIFSLDSFDTSKVTDMSYMFYNCDDMVVEITIRSTVGSVNYEKMFYGAAANHGAGIIVHYTSNTSTLVDNIVATRTSTRVKKGSLAA